VTYWDYDAPYNSTIPYQPRDTSATAIFASALVELSQYAPTPDLKDRFLTNAKAIVEELSSPKYIIYGDKDYKLPALLANGTVGPYPRSPYDVALAYGDYYLTQAIIRLSKL
jgi:unsaturated chondroitin disaccharide hydrolase